MSLQRTMCLKSASSVDREVKELYKALAGYFFLCMDNILTRLLPFYDEFHNTRRLAGATPTSLHNKPDLQSESLLT